MNRTDRKDFQKKMSNNKKHKCSTKPEHTEIIHERLVQKSISRLVLKRSLSYFLPLSHWKAPTIYKTHLLAIHIDVKQN